jgi:tetratricopeptide (TPR) repeat protein
LAAAVDVRQHPPRTLTRLARLLEGVEPAGTGSRYATGPAAVALLRRAQRQYPVDFWINENLGNGLSKDKSKLEELTEAVRFLSIAVALRPESPGAYLNLGYALKHKGQIDEAIASFRKALELDPKYAAAHNGLGGVLCDSKHDYDGAIASFRKALELDAKFAWAHHNLGIALLHKGQVDEATASFRTVIALDPKHADAHFKLGLALAGKGQVDEAIASYKRAIELDPKYGMAHNNLGAILCNVKRDYDAAIACFRTAIALDPKEARAHNNLGIILCDVKRDYDGAISSFRTVIALDPNHASAHFNLGNVLRHEGQVDAAIACYQKAIEVDPKYTAAHHNLGLMLLGKGQIDEAIASFRAALALDPKSAAARNELAKAERLAAVQDKLPAFLKGDFQPTTNDERLALAAWCQIRKRHRTAADLFADAFTADPKLADGVRSGNRYDAARAAALAGCGQGQDAPAAAAERARWRGRALHWLQDHLALTSAHLASGTPQAREEVRGWLRHWQTDPDLAGVRDGAALTQLPAEERTAWTQLWADVAALVKKAEEKAQ